MTKLECIIENSKNFRVILLQFFANLRKKNLYEQLEIAIHPFAKGQMAWFRGMERRGITIHWLKAEMPVQEKIALVKEYRIRFYRKTHS